MMLDKEKVKDFLIELSLLTAKYEIEIGGCGCCGSPYLMECENDRVLRYYIVNGKNECLEYITPEQDDG